MPYWRLEKPIGPVFNGQEAQEELIVFPETSGRNYHITLREIPDERISHLHRGGSPKSRIGLLSLLIEIPKNMLL